MRIISESEDKTRKIAAGLARELVKSKKGKNALVVALEGELGVGKTVFVKGFAKALGVKEKITSPTFVIVKCYKLSAISLRPELRPRGYRLLYHIDAYRLKNEKELIGLGIKEIFSDPRNIVLIEWADRVKKVLPEDCISIHMDHLSEKERKINIIF